MTDSPSQVDAQTTDSRVFGAVTGSGFMERPILDSLVRQSAPPSQAALSIEEIRHNANNRSAAMSRIEEIIRGGNRMEIDRLRHALNTTPSTRMLTLCASEGVPVGAVWHPEQLLSRRWRFALSLAKWLVRMASRLRSRTSYRNPRYLKALEIRSITSHANFEAGIQAQAIPKASSSCEAVDGSSYNQIMQSPTGQNSIILSPRGQVCKKLAGQ